MVQILRRTTRGQIEKIQDRVQEMKLPIPKGRYRVELSDASSGKVQHVAESQNYVSPAHYRRASHYQGILPFLHGWTASGVFDTTNIFANTNILSNRWAFSPFHAPNAPDHAILTSNWGQAEDTDVDWAKGNVNAWAALIKRTVPASGKSGLINESESVLNNNLKLMKWVWDWTTQQGNGSFQSVMMSTVGTLIDEHCHIPVSAGQRGHAVNINGLGVNAVNTNSIISDPETDDLYALVFLTSGGNPRIVRWTAAQLEAAGTEDGSGLWNKGTAGTILSTPPSMTWQTGVGSATTVNWLTASIVKIPSSTDMVMIGRQTNGTLQVVRFNVSTGTGVYNNTTTGAPAGTNGTTTKVTSCCYAGGKIWALAGEFQNATVANTHDTNGYILRINPATGNVEVTLPLPSGVASWNSITTNGTLLMVSTNIGVMVFDQTGVNVEPYNLGQVAIRSSGSTGSQQADNIQYGAFNGYNAEAKLSFSGVSPASGTWWQGLAKGTQGFGYSRTPGAFVGHRDAFSSIGNLSFPWSSTWGPSPSIGPVFSPITLEVHSGHPKYVFHKNRLWVVGREWIRALDNGITTDTFALASVDGSNMFSRALLDSVATKTNSQNMKITYELTLPDDWYGVVPHVNPLALVI